MKNPSSNYRFGGEITTFSPVVSMQIFKEQFTDYLEQVQFKEQLADYLEQIKEGDPEYTIFGASSHKYTFGLKLSESAISVFEKKYAFTLPETYKTYLTKFGNGGAGPSYGMFELGKIKDGKPWPDNVVPGAEFSFTERDKNDDLMFVAKPEKKDFLNSHEYDQAYNIWDEVEQERYLAEHGINQGAIPICRHGSTYTTWLVVDVNCPEYGNIYYDADMGVEPDGSRMPFADWILDWCTTSLQNLESASS